MGYVRQQVNSLEFLNQVDSWVHVCYLPGEEIAANALWEEGRQTEAVLCSGQCSAGKPWVLALMWMFL